MSYRLLLTAGPHPHPPFKFDTLKEASYVAEKALKLGYLRRDEPDTMRENEDNVLIYQLGPGSSMHVASEERLDALVQKQQREQARVNMMAQGLVSPPSEKEEFPYYLVVQTPFGQLSPLGYATRAAAVAAVQNGIEKGWLHYSSHEAEHLYLQMGQGTLYMVLSAEHFEMQKRRAIEAAIQQAQREHQMQGQKAPLIIPGKN